MKKIITLLFALSMIISSTACGDKSESSASESSSESSAVSEEKTEAETEEVTTEAVTESPTEKATEAPTKADIEDLTEMVNCHDASFLLPSDYTETPISSTDGTYSYQYSFSDGSYMTVIYNTALEEMLGAYGGSVGSLVDPFTLLESTADGLVSVDGFEQVGDSEAITVDGLPGLRQKAEYAIESGGMTLVCEMDIFYVMHGSNIYIFQFADIPLLSADLASTYSEDIMKSAEFTEIAEEFTEPPENETKVEIDSDISLGMQNALEEAINYLEYSSFSYNGLIDQLEFEQYSHEEAVYAVDNCGADWYEQALLTAENYIEYSGFSYEGLVEQLEFEEFTPEQAIYGADNCGADWNKEAAETAQNYIDYSSFSRQELLDQLLYEGFTQEQAEHGVQSVGY